MRLEAGHHFDAIVQRCARGLIVLVATSIWFIAGCGEHRNYEYTSISGQVTFEGKPVQQGRISYFPSESGHGAGGSAPIVDGRYQLDKIPIGRNGFIFSASVETGKLVAGITGEKMPERVSLLPERYRTEGIVRDIGDGNIQDFALEK